ncbi:MAG: hypothetical protein H8E55_09780 [Pelagibacterales bacterium]|nr:hypothetical protein [Pelagibacterales bacterium]
MTKETKKMNLAKKYKQLFEGRLSSNDMQLISNLNEAKGLTVNDIYKYSKADPNTEFQFHWSDDWFFFNGKTVDSQEGEFVNADESHGDGSIELADYADIINVKIPGRVIKIK